MKVTTIYFSATYTTCRVVEAIAANLSNEVTTYDITNDTSTDVVTIPADELVVVGVPVYAGRVPAMAAERLRRFRGENTPAVVVAVYGNRHYDDAVLELHDIMTEQGFRTVSAGAFVAQHSIFAKVGKECEVADNWFWRYRVAWQPSIQSAGRDTYLAYCIA